jgi:mono/diheme cytochrome c family protein
MAQSTGETFKQQCVECHSLAKEQDDRIQSVRERKGPNMSYAGLKYKQAWLIKWLQDPTRIRPAGMFYGNHIKTSADGDIVDEGTLLTHKKLSASDAESMAAFLMAQKNHSDLVKAGDYQLGKISVSTGEMLFDKFRGCMACHEIEPGYGGLSGPEVYTASERLQEDFLVSFMRKPQAWDKRTLMPDKNLKEADLQKFVHYFHVLAERD